MKHRFVLAIGVAACGSDPSDHAVDAPSTTVDAPSTSGSPSDSLVELSILPGGSGRGAASIFAGPVEYDPACNHTTIGACQTFTCADAGSPLMPRVDAGAITINGGAQTITLQDDGEHLYQASIAPSIGSAFQPGTVVTFDGTGAAVPAFHETVTFPTAPQIDQPALGATVARSTDLSLAWSGGSGVGTMVVLLRRDTPATIVQCKFAIVGETGSVTIPAAALQTFTAGATIIGGLGYASVTSEGSDPISFFAGGPLWDAAHTAVFSGMLNLE